MAEMKGIGPHTHPEIRFIIVIIFKDNYVDIYFTVFVFLALCIYSNELV